MPLNEHKLMLSKHWYGKAEENIGQWGNQNPETILLAAVEELGEIAMEMEAQADFTRDLSGPQEQMLSLISEMATLGDMTRQFLESEFDEPAGESGPDCVDDIDAMTVVDQVAVQDEVDDLAPLLYQLTWALEEVDRDV